MDHFPKEFQVMLVYFCEDDIYMQYKIKDLCRIILLVPMKKMHIPKRKLLLPLSVGYFKTTLLFHSQENILVINCGCLC